MEIEERAPSASWRCSLLFSVVFLNICIPNLVLSYGVILVHSVNLGVPTWLGFSAPAVYTLIYSTTQCWFREAADSWGGLIGYRVMATIGLILIVIGLVLCALVRYHLQPFLYGVFGGLGSSLISAQIDAVIFENYDVRLGIVRGICWTGQAIGLSLFPHIISALIEYYGYSFSFIVLGGIMLQTLPAILFLKVDDGAKRPVSFSRYSDLAKTYAIFNNGVADDYYTAELQLHDLNKKCWKSPSDDNLHREEELIDDDEQEVDSSNIVTITPPPSPEEKRRNIFGVEILPEIPEESEESDNNDVQSVNSKDINKNKKRFSNAIKRLSTLGGNFDEYIAKQMRRDSQSDCSGSDIREYSELEVTYDNISPITDIQREKVFNSFSFRCQSAYANLKRRIYIPSYRVYRMRRRLLYFFYNINDTVIKPLTRSLSCWRFYPALILSFSKLSLTAIYLVLLPMIALQVKPKISMFESNFLMSLHAFTWICFLLTTPLLAQTPKRNYKYVVVFGLIVSTAACFVLAQADNHDIICIGCVVSGLGYGAIISCWETAVQDFVGVRKWPKLHSTLETLSAIMLVAFVLGFSFILEQEKGLYYCMFILGSAMSVVTFIWFVIAVLSFYFTNIRSIDFQRRQWLI